MKNVKNRLKFVLLPALVLLLVILAVPVSAGTGLPHNFSGTVKIGGVDAPIDTVISARFQDVEYGSVTTTDVGLYSYLLVTDLTDGDIIQFYVDDVDTTQTFPFGSGYTTELNLTVGEVTDQYSLTVASTAGGSVTDPGEGTFPDYAAGTVVDLLAVPDTGYQFVNWTGDTGDIANANLADTTITMNGDYSITANFAEVAATYSLTVGSTVGGSVTTPGEPGPFTYDPTTVVDLLAVPDTGYQFVSWTGDVGTVADVHAASTTITMNGDYSITANFGEIGVTYTLTISSTTGGSVTEPVEAISTHDSGTVVDLLAEADTGYQFNNWTGDTADIANANAASTTITMNGDYSINANFVEVTGDLGDLIDDTPSGGTLVLEAGTYTGNVTIDKPLTITGTEGETIISGGIHIVPLVGSNVTIENLTITDYSAYGIWIELVRDVDNFIIRNNTIEGVEGSIIGIQVDEVEAGGILEVEQNSISGNEIGIKLLAAVADGGIQFNDITGNTDFGLEQLAVGSDARARYNWWGDISGPQHETMWNYNTNPGGTGDKVSDNIYYRRWLTRDFQTVLDDNIAYFGGSYIVQLDTGWNIFSTPIALDPACDTWGEYVALGDGLDIHATNPAYSFDAQTQEYVLLTGDYRLKPCDAIYVRMAELDRAAILYSPDVSVPAKQLYAGWNLVSLAWEPSGGEERRGLPVDEALVSIAEVTGGLTGYVLVASPSVNQYSWIYTGDPSQIGTPDWEAWTGVEGWMIPTNGYWVFMLNDGTLAGFSFTPVSLN